MPKSERTTPPLPKGWVGPRPDWNDEEGVARLADKIIAAEMPFWYRCIDYVNQEAATIDGSHPSDEDDHWPAAARKELNKFIEAERVAVVYAKCGSPKRLAALLASEHADWAKPSTRSLAAEVFAGKYKRSGRPKVPLEERFAATPTHRAAAEAEVLRRRLRKLYPKIRPAAVRNTRADEIAAKRAGIATETVQNYVNSSKKRTQRRIV